MTTEQTPAGEEYIVLEDQEGHAYLLPRQTLEAARVTDDSLDKLHALVAGEVSGYAMAPPWNTFTSQSVFLIPPVPRGQGIALVTGLPNYGQ